MMRPKELTTIVLVLSVFMLLSGCGDAPTEPVKQYGSIVIDGQLGIVTPPDTNTIWVDADSITIWLDNTSTDLDSSLGTFANPHTLNVLAGTHYIRTQSLNYENPDPPEIFSSSPQMIEVGGDQTVEATFPMSTGTPTGPYANFMSPDFTIIDLQDNEYTLSSLSGKITILYFWSFT